MKPSLRVLATVVALLLLPPFIVLAVAPMLLLLVPVAMVGIPFLVPALMRGSIAARAADQQRVRARPLLLASATEAAALRLGALSDVNAV